MLTRIAAMASLVVLALAVAAHAGAAAPKASSSIQLVLLSAPTSSATSGPGYGDQVTFAFSTSTTDNPQVKLYCYQNGVWVYWNSASFSPDFPAGAKNFTLSSSYWTGGAADCTATLWYMAANGNPRSLASTSFHVNP